MKKIYIAGKYSANNTIQTLRNIGRGQQTAAQLFDLGFAPYCPWHDKTFITDNPDGDFDIKQFYEASILWMKSSDAIFVISGVGDGGGVDAEIKLACELSIPVFYDIVDLAKWSGLMSIKK